MNTITKIFTPLDMSTAKVICGSHKQKEFAESARSNFVNYLNRSLHPQADLYAASESAHLFGNNPTETMKAMLKKVIDVSMTIDDCKFWIDSNVETPKQTASKIYQRYLK